jgi:antitoxin component of MazEF toxin-antitoxin module
MNSTPAASKARRFAKSFAAGGNSLAVPIPKALADAIKTSDGKRAEIKIETGTLVLRLIFKKARKSRDTLEELLSGIDLSVLKQTCPSRYPASFLKTLSKACASLHVASSDCQSSGGFPFFSIAAKTA